MIDYVVDTVTDFLIELGMKPCMHLVEISIFSLNNVTGRTTQNYFENQKFDAFGEIVYNFGKSDGDII